MNSSVSCQGVCLYMSECEYWDSGLPKLFFIKHNSSFTPTGLPLDTTRGFVFTPIFFLGADSFLLSQVSEDVGDRGSAESFRTYLSFGASSPNTFEVIV